MPVSKPARPKQISKMDIEKSKLMDCSKILFKIIRNKG